MMGSRGGQEEDKKGLGEDSSHVLRNGKKINDDEREL